MIDGNLKEIQEFDLSKMKILNSEMKINTKDFFRFLQQVQALANDTPMTPEQKKYMTYFFNRYVMVPQLRAEEKQWFDIVKDLTDGKYNDLSADQDVKSLLKSSKKFYQDAKQNRINMIEYLDSIKNIYY